MIPLFKSHYSIGKSILRVGGENSSKEGSDGIAAIAKEQGLKEVVLVEDSLTGFLEAQKSFNKSGIKFIFGLRCTFCNNIKNTDSAENSDHKVIIFAKNAKGVKLLNEIQTFAQLQGEGKLDLDSVKNFWCNDSLKMVIPFYDSFIYNNYCRFSNCIPDFKGIEISFFIEDNLLPIDQIITPRVQEYCESNGLQSTLAKSIFYKKRSDFNAYVTYKSICNRKKFMASLDKPGFDHLGSREFCIESWRERIKK
tara:strand:- start:21026 stop:21781 length:756 start_codon:yes stop_codon:yes gene_type:complete